jgi:hypothetical protein
MTRSNIQKELNAIYPAELVDSLMESYEKAVSEYKKAHWQYFGNEVGQFIEIGRRMIELQTEKKYTPLSNKLSIFNERVLLDWENHPSSISESYRIIIPRALYAMYCIRNKRGMIHKNEIDPNKMDAIMLLSNMKWVFAELFRLASKLSFDEAIECIDSIMIRETIIVWDNGTMLRILDVGMKTKDKILCLLYVKDSQDETELKESIEYKNISDFRKILRDLHSKRLIEYKAGVCRLSPLGIQRAEELLAR